MKPPLSGAFQFLARCGVDDPASSTPTWTGALMSNRTRILLLALLTGLVALAPAVADAGANTICVGGRHCYATIQSAVNAAGDGETIRIGPGTFAGGVTIDRSVNLIGVAPGTTRISGGGPVLTVGSNTATPTVTLADLTITGGDTSSDPQAPRCGPDLTTCGPGYTAVTALGGGIEAFAGTNVTIRDSLITGNRAVPHGSVPSVVAMCPGGVPCPASFGDGAGIDDWGAMTLIGTTVSDNHAAANQSDGGGIVVESGASLSMARSIVTGNSATALPPTGRFAAGGGIYVDGGGAVTVEGSAIDANSSRLSNSIPSPYPDQVGATDNENAQPGGVFLSDGSTATIRNSTLDRNAIAVNTPLGQAFAADAALCACGDVPLTIANSRIDDNTLTVNVLSSDANGPSGPAAFEADANATITNTRIAHNTTTVTAPTGDAAAVGAVGFFFSGTVTPTMSNSQIVDNRSSATAPKGAATVQGAGISNNGPLVLTNDRVSGNTGSADGQSGFAQGGGIWNGVLFGGPTSPLTLQDTAVTRNTLSGSSADTLQGAGIFTLGFPTTLTNSIVASNAPDQCDGC
jgi:hypothetical protein